MMQAYCTPNKELKAMIQYIMNNRTSLQLFLTTCAFLHFQAHTQPASFLMLPPTQNVATNVESTTGPHCCWKSGSVLELTIGEQFPPAKTVLHAYLHFEALTSDEYEYSCVTCGDSSAIVIMDLHRKGAFNMSLSDIKPPPKEFKGNVNIEDFWRKLSLQMIGRGFVKSNSLASMCLFLTVGMIHAIYFLLPPVGAPWIGRNTRKSNQCLNTEFQKIHQPKEAELCEITVSEDRLKNELYKKKVSVIRKLCKECGVDSIGSKSDLLERLSSEMKSRRLMTKYLKRFGVPQTLWLKGNSGCATLADFVAPVTGMETNADVSIEEEDEPMIVENADEDLDTSWGTERLADEVIVKEGATCSQEQIFGLWVEKGNGV
ncbi:hypothetical protein QQF64_023636 [Cirrhinus molitorella]|uniref:SAP domain-containing protein n=1 Tax=Cirrhinus molitorella TaxID=172907 RepID=A0ABR3NIZ6_9TELE